MSQRTHTGAGTGVRRSPVFLLSEQQQIVDGEPSFWGGNWASRFAAQFDDPEDGFMPGRTDDITKTVNRAIARLPELDQRIIEDYYVFCLPRRAIAHRRGLDEREVDKIRACAERRLRVMLTEFVEHRFGLVIPRKQECTLCGSISRTQIDGLLAGRRPKDSWGSLRRRINERFGLDIKRVQTVMTHCRYHMAIDNPPAA